MYRYIEMLLTLNAKLFVYRTTPLKMYLRRNKPFTLKTKTYYTFFLVGNEVIQNREGQNLVIIKLSFCFRRVDVNKMQVQLSLGRYGIWLRSELGTRLNRYYVYHNQFSVDSLTAFQIVAVQYLVKIECLRECVELQVEAGDVLLKVNGTDVNRFTTREGKEFAIYHAHATYLLTNTTTVIKLLIYLV